MSDRDNSAGLRKIGWIAAASLVFSNMVGSGIFTTSGFLLENLRSAWLLLAVWAAGGVLAVAGALSYAELGASLPRSGGDYVYLRKAYGPVWAFITGWMAFIAGIGAPIGLAALTCMEYTSTFFPALTVQGHEPLFAVAGLTVSLSPGQAAAAGLIWLLTGVHWLGIRAGGRWQSAITMVNISLIVGFILAAVLAGGGDWGNFSRAVPLENAAAGAGGASMFAVSLIWVMFGYSGFNAAAYVAGEIHDPALNLPRALITGVLTVTVLYLGLNVVYILAAAPSELAGKLDVARVAAGGMFGAGAEMLVSLVIATCAAAAASAMICVGPRVYNQMARDGAFFASAGRINRRGTPGGALLLQGLWASLLILMGSFDQLLTFTGFLLSLFSALAVASVIVLRLRFPELPRPYRAWGYPVTPLLYVAVSLWMMAWSVYSRPAESLIGLALVGAGLPVYWYWRRSGAGATDQEPSSSG